MKILEMIEEISDPRMEGKVHHRMSTIIFGALCGVLCGCETWNDIRDYCAAKREWLEQYISFENGIPSGGTFRRVFTLLDPNNIELLLRMHASQIIAGGKVSDQIAIDGKSLRGSKGRLDTRCLHSMSAWCRENSIVLGEKQVDSGSNEITAIPLLLESLELRGNTVTIDAAGCQKSVAKLITEKKGHYLLGLKRNHKKLYQAITNSIESYSSTAKHCLADYFDDSHGRSVRRRVFSYDITGMPDIQDWHNARTVVALETISSKDNDPERRVTASWRYYLSSHLYHNKQLPDYIRNQWGIENKLHWVLDVHLKEDNDKKAERKSARSFSLLKRIALNMVRAKDKTPNMSLRRKLKTAAWSDDYLLQILQ